MEKSASSQRGPDLHMPTKNPLILLFMLITPAALSVFVYMCTIYTCV